MVRSRPIRWCCPTSPTTEPSPDIAGAANPTDWPVLQPELLRAPVPRPPKGFGVALNYRQHAIESGLPLPTEPHLFGKMENCVCGPYDEIIVPAGRDMVDYEAELVIVFGRTCNGRRPPTPGASSPA